VNQWPKEKQDTALRMFAERKTAPEIAADIGKKTRAVEMWLYRQGLRRGPRPITYTTKEIRLIRKRAKLRYNAEEIGSPIGRTASAIKGICRRQKIHLRSHRRDGWKPYELDALLQNDKKLKDFGAGIGRSRDAVAQKKRELGIRRWSADMEWPSDKVEILRNMTVEGTASASEIAAVLGPEFTRSAVCGKASRLGLKIRAVERKLSAEARARKNERKRAARQAAANERRVVVRRAGNTAVKCPEIIRYVPPSEPALPPPEIAPRGAGPAHVALTFDSCRWPHGHADDDDFCFCMAPISNPYDTVQPPYCDWHILKAASSRAG
jgi:GcrA cell cycle regulator